jgi:hypothetical protein
VKPVATKALTLTLSLQERGQETMAKKSFETVLDMGLLGLNAARLQGTRLTSPPRARPRALSELLQLRHLAGT